MRETLAEARRFLSLPLPTSFGSRSPRARKTPAGTPVAARRLWAAAKPVGDTLVAAYLAARGTRGVPQVAFRPDWNRDKKAAPFKRNERLIDAMPTGLIVFSGTGIQDNLVDKARAFGIPVWDFRIKEAG
ncbi:DUF7146 domain-containing protein [Sphingopyxis sp. A083]|uniref:DUF7146 domain-containing protein n=1 Tax=Sphingopyxis sp. A083 TaxID=1759083 RepID=UPI003FA73393